MASKCQSRASFDKERCLTKTFLLWPDSTEAQAQTNLRRELHNLREALPEADRLVDSAGRTLHWRADEPATVDLIDFEVCLCAASAAQARRDAMAARGYLERAMTAYGGDLPAWVPFVSK